MGEKGKEKRVAINIFLPRITFHGSFSFVFSYLVNRVFLLFRFALKLSSEISVAVFRRFHAFPFALVQTPRISFSNIPARFHFTKKNPLFIAIFCSEAKADIYGLLVVSR